MMTVRLIYKTSRFYNTSDYITGFLQKITNQIILACESYLTNSGVTSIWKQNTKSMIEKIDVIIHKCLFDDFYIFNVDLYRNVKNFKSYIDFIMIEHKKKWKIVQMRHLGNARIYIFLERWKLLAKD